MYWDVKVVKPLSDYRIYVEIEDGRKGIFDMKPYLDKGVFQELKDVGSFKMVGILFGASPGPMSRTLLLKRLLLGCSP